MLLLFVTVTGGKLERTFWTLLNDWLFRHQPLLADLQFSACSQWLVRKEVQREMTNTLWSAIYLYVWIYSTPLNIPPPMTQWNSMDDLHMYFKMRFWRVLKRRIRTSYGTPLHHRLQLPVRHPFVLRNVHQLPVQCQLGCCFVGLCLPEYRYSNRGSGLQLLGRNRVFWVIHS